MEHKFYTDDFERLLKEKSDEFRMYPSKRVWHSIYNDLHPDRKWPSIAVTLLLVTALFLIGYWNNSNGSSENLTAANAKKQGHSATAQSFINEQTGSAANAKGTDNVVLNNSAASRLSSLSNNSSLQNNQYDKTSQTNTFTKHHTGTVTSVKFTSASEKQLLVSVATFNNTNNDNLLNTSIGAEVFNALSSSKNNQQLTSAPEKAVKNKATVSNTVTEATGSSNESFNTEEKGNISSVPSSGKEITQDALAAATKSGTQKSTSNINQLSAQDKSWIEHYALYNKTTRKKWRGRLSSEMYLTPGISIRSFYSNTMVKVSAPLSAVSITGSSTDMPSYNPGFTFQAGAGLSYAIAKNIRIKTGLQASFTNYSIPVTDINHPVLTTLTFNNLNSGYPYLESRASSIANIPGHNNKKIHNQTSQISIPIGLAVKLAGNDKLQWYAGGTVQPTLVLSGKAYLLSSDNNNFVSDPSLLRKFNLNGAAETYIHYKMNGFTLQAGPELRYQFNSTYFKKYANTEKLHTIGIKVGIVKNL